MELAPYERLPRKDEDEKRSVKPKTYLIESNSELKAIAANGYQLKASEDSTLWNIVCKDGPAQFYMYLDVLDPRYWKIHSVYYAGESDNAVESLISHNENHLDHLWLSSDSLEYLSRGKESTGFGISYDNLFVANAEELPSLSMRLWGGNVPSILKGLRGIGPIKNQISLSNIGIKFRAGKGFSKEDIYQKGKLTARGGTSIDSHLNLIDGIKEYYSGIISEIEQDYRMRFNYHKQYCTVEGTYSVIQFANSLSNLKEFAEILLSGSDPFRLWGMWKEVEKDFLRINAVDLHTNSPVKLELMKDEMRVILGEHTCGNAVTRLFTNIQNNFDSGCKLLGKDNAELIRPHQDN